MKKIANLIFPIVAVIGLFIALLDYWGLKEIRDYQQKELADPDQRIIQTEETLRTNEKLKTMDETISVSYDDLIREHKRDNENLKQRTLKFSPGGKKYAYFQNKFTTKIEEIGDEDYTSLIVYHKGREETVFQGNFRLSYIEWLNDEEMVIYRSCGTECMIAYNVDLENKTTREFTFGVGYTWSPNKKYILAYNFSYKYGISVAERGDLYGRRIFELRRNNPPRGSGLVNKTKAVWSPDSSKLALVIKKEDKEKLELLVFAVQRNFEIILQKNLESMEFADFDWKDEKTVFFIVDEKTNEIKL